MSTLVVIASAWITGSYAVPDEKDYEKFFEEAPAPVVRRVFDVPDGTTGAVFRVASPAMRDIEVNGARLTSVTLPPWTLYDYRVMEETYDLKPFLRDGENVLTVRIGNGWWNPLPMKMWGFVNLRDALPHGTPSVRGEIELMSADGTRTVLPTDGSWEAADGDIVFNNLYIGEKRDLRRKTGGWKPAREVPGPTGRIVPRGDFPPVTVIGRWKAKSVRKLANGDCVVDFGVNFAGTMKASVRNVPAGAEVSFVYGECLSPDGSVNYLTTVCGQMKNPKATPLGVAKQRDRVVSAGADFVYEPRMTFHTFRYMQVTGLAGTPAPEDFEAQSWSCDVKDAASFVCADEKLLRLREMCRRTFRANLQSVQSDCPARERFDYMGDLSCSAESFILNYDMHAFYVKTVRDAIDGADRMGGKIEVTNHAIFGPTSSPGDFAMGFSTGLPVLLDLLVRYYGDVAILEEAYPTLVRFLDHVGKHYPDRKLPFCHADHEALEKIAFQHSTVCHYRQFALLTAKFARRLGKAADVARFEKLAEQLKADFRGMTMYVNMPGFVGNGRQSDEVFALYHGMFDGETRQAAYDLLRENVVGHGNALSTGIFGTQYLLEVLTANGDAELAGKVVTHEGFPGWYHMMDRGATTLWETWNETSNVYSMCHPMFGSVAAWLMRGIIGIKVCEDATGCDRVRIEPHAVCGLSSASGHYDTPKGRISVSWKLVDGKMEVDYKVPDGVTVVK